jgi:hypothetical protein
MIAILLMDCDDTVDYWYFSVFNFEYNNFTTPDRILLIVGKEEEITTEERWFHAPTQNHNNGAFTTGDDHETFP